MAHHEEANLEKYVRNSDLKGMGKLRMQSFNA